MLIFHMPSRAAVSGMFLLIGAVAAWRSISSAPFKNVSNRSKPKYRLNGTPPTADVTLYRPPI